MKKSIWIVLLRCLFFSSQVFAATCGNVNNDGIIDILDALFIARYYVNPDPANFNSTIADVNGNNSIDILDALLVAQYYVDLIDELNCAGPTLEPTPTLEPPIPPTPGPTVGGPGENEIGLYTTFERTITNNNNYSNKFTDMELQVSYSSPSGKTIDFFGFFDGEVNGGGSGNFTPPNSSTDWVLILRS